MAHLVDGVLSAPVLVTGAAIAATGLALSLRRLDQDQLPRTAMLSAAFFVVSLIQVPLAGTSVHLIMAGLLGILLGWLAIPAIFIGLLLQAVLFGVGGVTALGVNLMIMAAPAIACHFVFEKLKGRIPVTVLGGLCGGLAVLMTALLVSASLVASGPELVWPANLVLMGHLPALVLEVILTATAVRFLAKVRPDLLGVTGASADFETGREQPALP
ncbi:MAG: cobalt transporter CbiM [Magnetovibrionaceae bacterium]